MIVTALGCTGIRRRGPVRQCQPYPNRSVGFITPIPAAGMQAKKVAEVLDAELRALPFSLGVAFPWVAFHVDTALRNQLTETNSQDRRAELAQRIEELDRQSLPELVVLIYDVRGSEAPKVEREIRSPGHWAGGVYVGGSTNESEGSMVNVNNYAELQCTLFVYDLESGTVADSVQLRSSSCGWGDSAARCMAQEIARSFKCTDR
jgi:hypothetical protein